MKEMKPKVELEFGLGSINHQRTASFVSLRQLRGLGCQLSSHCQAQDPSRPFKGDPESHPKALQWLGQMWFG